MLIPYATDRPRNATPLFVVTLVLLHYTAFAVVALALTSNSVRMVEAYTNLSLIPSHVRWYSPITYSMLHDGVFHLSVNMLFLWVFGSAVEEALGWRRFALLYLVFVVATGMLQVGMTLLIPGADRSSPIVGASGAISAIVGVFSVRFYRSRLKVAGIPGSIPAVGLIAMALLGEMGAVVYKLLQADGMRGGSIAHWAHIGGFVLGMGLAQLTRQATVGKREYMVADASVETETGSPLSAVRRWEAVLKTNPADHRARAELGRSWALAGEQEQSIEAYRAAISGYLKAGNRRDAATRYGELLSFHPEATLGIAEQFSIGRALEDQGSYEEAVVAYERFVKTYPQARDVPMSYLRMAVIRLQFMNQPDPAYRAAEILLSKYPDSEWRDYAEKVKADAAKALFSPPTDQK